MNWTTFSAMYPSISVDGGLKNSVHPTVSITLRKEVVGEKKRPFNFFAIIQQHGLLKIRILWKIVHEERGAFPIVPSQIWFLWKSLPSQGDYGLCRQRQVDQGILAHGHLPE